MKHLKCIVAIAIVACAAMVGTSTITATTDASADEAIVAAMANPPEFLTSWCIQPTRANISFYRTVCDEEAERRGYSHGILHPRLLDDDKPLLFPNCEADPKTGTPAGERYYCFGVGGGQ